MYCTLFFTISKTGRALQLPLYTLVLILFYSYSQDAVHFVHRGPDPARSGEMPGWTPAIRMPVTILER